MRWRDLIIGAGCLAALGCGVEVMLNKAEPPPACFELAPTAQVFASMRDFGLVQEETKKGEFPTWAAKWEIRDADQHRRVAMIPAVAGNEFYGYVNDQVLQRYGPLPPGNYRLALLIGGVRASNVVAFRIDPNFDAKKAPVLAAGMEEAPPGQSMGTLLAWAVGPTPQDMLLTNQTVFFARIEMDGVEIRGIGGPWSGPVHPLRSGQPWIELYPRGFFGAVDLAGPHDFQLKAGKYTAEAHLNLSEQPLGDEWDRTTRTLSHVPNAFLRGEVTDPRGLPARKWIVQLIQDRDPNKPSVLLEKDTDENGDYAFPDIEPGEYRMECEPNTNVARPTIFVKRVEVADGENRMDLTVQEKYRCSGRVTDTAGKPWAGSMVTAEWDDAAGNINCDMCTTTKADGSYEIGGPYPKLHGVMVYGRIESKVRGDATAGETNVDFVLRR